MSDFSATSRRRFLLMSALLGGGALAAACGGAPASPTAAPAKPAEPAKPAAEPTKPAEAKPAAEPTKPAAVPSGAFTPKPRNRTLFLMWSGREGKYVDHELWNGYAVGANHQNGLGILHEPLALFSAFAGKEILWLAESYKYSPDFKDLTIKTRSGITWSDGAPFSANDVAFTIEGLKRQGAKVRWGIDVQQFVEEAKATDANTVQVKFKVPAPRFFDLLTYKFDIGVYVVPKHIFEKEDDWSKFQNFDLAKGLPLTTGPWKVVFAAPDQKVIDRRDSWWAVRAGLAEMPKVERIVYLPNTGETQMAQAYITNQIDCSLDLRPNTIKTVIAQNPKIITHAGRELPYGYVDWWPTSLYLNNEVAPWSDKDVRWAISNFIDRKQVVEVGYGGAGTISKLPMPTYKPLLPYFDAVKDLLEKYDTTRFDPAAGNEILVKKGWKKGGDGFYADDKGNRVKLEIGGSPIFADIGPVIVEQLKRQGIDANFLMPPDMGQRFQRGEYTGNLSGHGGSVNDPYRTLRLYQSASLAVPGSHQSNFSRWKNADYDKVVDQVYSTPMDDQKKLIDLFRQAMQIWLPELPDIQITEWYHRIPMNTQFWTGWPTKDDPYVNGAFWHLTFQLILNKLAPAQ